MSESWDDYADEWDSNEAVVLYSSKAYDSLLNVVELEGYTVLDFGCGTGLLSEKISCLASSVVALDPSEKMISVLAGKQLANVHLIASELSPNLIDTNEHLRDGFDLIVASSALAFVPDYLDTLKLLKQLLKKGGLLIQWDWLKEDEAPGIGFSQKAIESALKQAGFSEYSTSIPFAIADPDGSMDVVMGIAKNVMNPAPIKELITYEDFEKLDIRIGTILTVSEVEKSSKLMKLTVDFGDHVRSILAGIKQERKNPAEIEGKQALFVVRACLNIHRTVLSGSDWGASCRFSGY